MITLLIDGLIAAVKTIDRAFTAVENVSVYEMCPRYSYILDRFVAIFGPKDAVA